jgi:hypothetical protein
LRWKDYTNFAMMARYLAGPWVAHVPINSMKGSDMLKYSAWMGDEKGKAFAGSVWIWFRSCIGTRPETGILDIFTSSVRMKREMLRCGGDPGGFALEHARLQGGDYFLRRAGYTRSHRAGS